MRLRSHGRSPAATSCCLRGRPLLGTPGATTRASRRGHLEALPSWPTSDRFDDTDRACLAFTEQFVIDVASMPTSWPTPLPTLGGDGLRHFVNALLVARAAPAPTPDLGPTRHRGSLVMTTRTRRLPEVPGADSALLGRSWSGRPQLCASAVDPITTELVRLRCAQHHDCHT